MKKILISSYLVLSVLSSQAAQASQPKSSGLNAQQIKQAYAASYQYESAQNYNDAIKSIRLVEMQYPKSYTINLRLGYLFYQQGHYANALKYYEQAHQAQSHAISPLLGEMSVNIAQQNYQKAEQAGFNILKADLNNYYANLKLGYIFIKTHKIKAAQQIVKKMLTLYPEDVSFLTQQAQISVLKKDWAAATQAYTSVQILDPENVAAKYYFSFPKKKTPEVKK